MKYTVIWVKLAQDRLASLWLSSRFASQITTAADWFEASLAVRPYDISESRTANLRIAFNEPLAIRFLVDEADKKVFVIDVWLI